jgi:hypothetical protein
VSSQVRTSRSLVIAAALPKYRLVRQDSNGKWALCGVGEVPEAINSVESNTAMATDLFQAACELLASGRTAILVASVAITAGQSVYAAASGKITNLVTGTAIGIAREAATADLDEIEVELRPDLVNWVGKIVGPSTSIAGTAADTAYDKTVTIGANTLKIGSKLRIRAKVLIPTTTGAETLLLKAKIFDGTNTVVLGATAAIDVADGDIGVLDIEAELPTATTILAAGVAAIGVPTTATARATGVASSTFDPTVASTVSVTQTASSTGETSALSMLSVEIHR